MALVHWYRSDSGLWQDAGVTPAAADGDVVGRWEDKTANDDHVNQAVADRKPTLQSGAGDTLNGYPVLRFNGITTNLQGAFTTGGAIAQPFTVFVVAKLDASAVDDDDYYYLTDGDDVANRMVLMKTKQGAPLQDRWLVSAGTSLNGKPADANWNIWAAVFNGASSRFWLNNVAECSTGNAGAQAPDGITIGAAPTGVYAWKGDIVEIRVYNEEFSDADREGIVRDLAGYYNSIVYLSARVAVSLPYSVRVAPSLPYSVRVAPSLPYSVRVTVGE